MKGVRGKPIPPKKIQKVKKGKGSYNRKNDKVPLK